MWKLDPESGNSFSAHAELKSTSGQGSLFDKEPQTSKLSSLLTQKFSGRKKISVAVIFKWVIEDTENFLPKHARAELERLYDSGSITYADPENSDRKRRKNTWPERLLVDFK